MNGFGALGALQDLGEYVVPCPLDAADSGVRPDVLAWRFAADEARAAYEYWRTRRDAESYTVYRACADRADAAQAAVAAR